MQCILEAIDQCPEARETELGFCGEAWVMRDDNGIIVGFYTMMNATNDSAELSMLEVLDEHRRQGYATKAIQNMFEKNEHIQEIHGFATDEAIDFYLSLGAEFHETCENCEFTECKRHTENPQYDDSARHCDGWHEYEFSLSRDSVLYGWRGLLQ